MTHPSRQSSARQGLLFDAAAAEQPQPGLARSEHDTADTQRESLRMIAGQASTIRERVYALLLRRGARGATNEELSDELGIRLATITPRVTELRKLGRVRDSGARRLTSSRRPAIVWAVTNSVAGTA